MPDLLESVAAALASGRGRIGIVCDKELMGIPLLEKLEAAFGPVPTALHPMTLQTGSGVWGLVPGCWVTMIGWGQQLAGQGFDAILVVDRPSIESVYCKLSIDNWYDQALRCRLLPGGLLEEVDQ